MLYKKPIKYFNISIFKKICYSFEIFTIPLYYDDKLYDIIIKNINRVCNIYKNFKKVFIL